MTGMSRRTRFTAYITKYALTKGILAREVEDCFHISPTMVSETARGQVCYHAGDWHHTRAEAVTRVHALIAAKRESIGRILRKLDKLEAALLKESVA